MSQTLNNSTNLVKNTAYVTPLVTCSKKTREISLFGEINYASACQLISYLRELDSVSHKPIKLFLSSEGGYIYPSNAIYDTIRIIKSRVFGIATGCCFSSMAYLLQACDTRYLTTSCRFMIHDVYNTVFDNEEEEEADPDPELLPSCTMMYHALAEKSYLTIDQVIELCNNETYMSAQEAVDYGFVDAVLEKEI
jgi:ATP-dependent Clp protease, protease subunit